MNSKLAIGEKGIYTVMVALLAIVLISSSIFSAKADIASEIGVNSNAINAVASGWQNARYLLDKTTSDAIYDLVAEQIEISKTCTLPSIGKDFYQSKISLYYSNIFSDLKNSQNLDCSYSSINVTKKSSSEIDAVFSLYCRTSTPQMSEISFRDGVSIKKGIVVLPSGKDCLLKIRDRDLTFDVVKFDIQGTVPI